MEDVRITWNIQNWITVVLMFIIGVLVINLGAFAFDKVTG